MLLNKIKPIKMSSLTLFDILMNDSTMARDLFSVS